MKLGEARIYRAQRLVDGHRRRTRRKQRLVRLQARPHQACVRPAAAKAATFAHQPRRGRSGQDSGQYIPNSYPVEEAFKNLKGDLAIRPIFHQLPEGRIEAHIMVLFLAYCLHVTLTRRLHSLAPGLTARSALAKFAAVQMIDVHLPTTDGREIVLTRYTEPEPDLRLLIARMKLDAAGPAAPENRRRRATRRTPPCSEDLFRSRY